MKQYSSFIFDSYAFDAEAGKIELRYSLDDSKEPVLPFEALNGSGATAVATASGGAEELTTGDEVFFTETLLLPADYQLQAPSPEQDKAIAALHLIGGISYYKTCLPKKIALRSGSLTQEQAQFWNTVYTKGLGEFFFKNQIDFRGLINFPTTNNKQQTTTAPTPYSLLPTPRLLVPIGGGKDSIVTAELLKKAGYDVTLFRIGRHPLIEQTAKAAGLPLLTVERHLAPELFKLNAEGALNGHVPITAYLSFLSVVIAELYGFHAIVMSNERSASEGNVEYLGERINHQWSKSLEFERLLRQYMESIGTNVEYFSLLRPLSELHIAKIFMQYPQYLPLTTSCNTNWRLTATLSLVPSPTGGGVRGGGQTHWCGTCPKCAFVFALFAPYLPRETLVRTFGKDLFADAALLPLFRQLLGLEGFKPFECVGTPEEMKTALFLAQETGEWDDTSVIQMYLKELPHLIPNATERTQLLQRVFTPSDDHCIPEKFHSALPEVLSPLS